MVRSQSGPDVIEAELLAGHLRALGELSARPAWGRASAACDHLGAKLADAVLQSGVGYEAFVRRRVERIAAEYPAATTARGFQATLRQEGASVVLSVASGRKLRTIQELADFCVGQGIETCADLRHWLQVPGNSPKLQAVHGVGPKTINFLKLLVGLDAIAVDIHIRRFVFEAGLSEKDPERIEALLLAAGKIVRLSGSQVDELVWRSMAARTRGRKSTRGQPNPQMQPQAD
jgi:hypothetical protein